MMVMRIPRWLLFVTALGLASNFGCESNAPATESAGGKDDGEATEPSMADDGNVAASSADAGAKPASPKPKDAGTATKPSGTDAAVGKGNDKDAAASAGSTGASPDDAAAADSKDAGSKPVAAGGAIFPPVDSVDKDGPFTPTHIENGSSTGTSWVFYPKELGKDGVKHPVFNWGPGATTGPSQYTDHLNRLASHGFVVISQPSSGTGTDEKAALDWLLAQNDKSGSPFYQKLDPKRVGAGGHSLGSLTTMKMAADPRLTTYILVCGGCMSGSGGCGAKDIHGPTVILGGDSDIGTPNFDSDYKEISSPVVFLTKSGTDHIACARNNLAPWVAYMLWHLAGDEKWKPKFFDGGEYCMSPWTCKSKNY